MIKSHSDLSVSNIIQSIIFLTRVYLQLKEINLRTVVLCYISEQLNLFGFIMNLIENFYILQYC